MMTGADKMSNGEEGKSRESAVNAGNVQATLKDKGGGSRLLSGEAADERVVSKFQFQGYITFSR